MAITTIAGVPLEEYGDTMKIAGVIVSDGHKDWVSFMIENQERYTRAGDWAIWYAKTQNTPN